MFIRSQAKFKVHFPKNLGGREPIKKMYRDGDLGSVRQLFGKPASPVRVSVEGLTIFLILIGALGRQQAMVQVLRFWPTLWETQKDFLTPSFDLACPWLLRTSRARMRRLKTTSSCLFLSIFCHFGLIE